MNLPRRCVYGSHAQGWKLLRVEVLSQSSILLLQLSHSGSEGVTFLDHAGQGLLALHLERYFLTDTLFPLFDFRVIVTGGYFHGLTSVIPLESSRVNFHVRELQFLFELVNPFVTCFNLSLMLTNYGTSYLYFCDQFFPGQLFQGLLVL